MLFRSNSANPGAMKINPAKTDQDGDNDNYLQIGIDEGDDFDE